MIPGALPARLLRGNCTKRITTVFLALLWPMYADATIVYSATLGKLYESNQPTEHRYGFSATDPRPVLTGDFSTDKRFEILLSAPAGMRFEITPPPVSATLIAQIWTTGGVSWPVHIYDQPGEIVGVSGPTPPQVFGEFVYPGYGLVSSDMAAYAGWQLDGAGPFSFESIRITIDVPNDFNFKYTDFRPDTVSVFIRSRGDLDPDLDRLFSLVPIASVPASGTLLLFGIGFVALGAGSNRQRTIRPS